MFKGELMDGMSGAPSERAVFSALTMALIDDTGWYNANWDLKVCRKYHHLARNDHRSCLSPPRKVYHFRLYAMV